MKKILFTIICTAFFGHIFAQKRVHFSEIELQKNGLYYQINTIDAFTGTAYEVHPPKGEKQKKLANEDFEAFLKSARKKEEVTFVNGKIDGKAKGWDEFGKKVYEGNFVAGKRAGLERQWYPNGQQKVEVTYANDLVNGTAKEWYMNGARKSEGDFLDGNEQGTHTWWYENDVKDQQITYENGLEEGIVRKWYQNSERMLEAAYSEGKREGLTQEWYKNGQLKGSGNYREGKEIGRFEGWSAKGKLLDVKIYENGELMQSMDYRSGGIRSKTGFVQVFNEMTSYFKIDIVGTDVKTINTGNIGFLVDGKILQMLVVPIAKFDRGMMPLQGEELLLAQMRDEMNNVRSGMDEAVAFEVFPEFESLSLSPEWATLHWWFKSPIKAGDENKARTVLEEHYVSAVCGDYILVLSSVVTNSDDRNDIINLLKKTAKTIDIAGEPTLPY